MDLLSSALGAVGQVGDAIDKYTGGRAVRGTLAGKPRELASIVPFSDTLGLTRPEDATSGRDLTDSYGLTTKGSNSFGSHAAGFVADNVLSPANWLGAGAAFKAAPTLTKGAIGAAKALTGADLLDHVAGGAKKLGSFLGGESGSLKLPFDHLPKPPSGMLRSDPEWINNRTAFHGSPHPDITSDSINPSKTKEDGLFGRGIYTTDHDGIAKTYADSGTTSARKDMVDLFNHDNTRQLLRDGKFPEELIKKLYGDTSSLTDYPGGNIGYDIHGIAQQMSRFGPNSDPFHKSLYDLYSKEFGGRVWPEPTIYQGKSNYNKILDLDSPPPSDLPDAAEAMAHKLGDSAYASKIRGLSGTGANAGKYVSMAKRASLDWGYSNPDHLTRMLKGDLGYDALTHTGGERQGQGKLLHQVTIGLDPNDKYGLGRSTPYSMWEAIKNFGKDESGALDIGAFGSKARSGLAPKAVATTQVNTAIQEAAKQFARFNTDTQFGPASDLAARFIRPPELPSDPAQAKQLADRFTDTMAKGRDSASAYFGPTYYDINNYLRTLGPEAAQAEVQAIREGRARVPGVTPPKPLSDPQKFDLNNFYKHYGHSPDTFSSLSPDEHGEFFDQLEDFFGPSFSKQYVNHFKSQSAPSTAAASIENWDDTPTLPPSQFQNIPAAPTFIPDKEKLAEFEKLSKKKIEFMLPKYFTKPNDFYGVQAAGKQVFGDQYDDYLTHLGLKLTQSSAPPAFTPDPSKLSEFDKLTGESHEHLSPSEFTNKYDAMGTQAIGKKIFGDEYGKYVDYIGKKAGFSPKSLADSIANAGQPALAFTPDPAKLAEFDKLSGVPHKETLPADFTNKSDFGGVQAVGKQVFGDQYDQYVNHINHINGNDMDFNLPGSPKPDALDAFDEADFFGLPPDGATPAPAVSHHSNPSPLAKSTLDPDEAFRLEGIRKHIAGLSGLIDNSALPQDMDLFRGVDGPGMRKISQLIGAPLNSPQAVGREFVDPAFMSTAFEKRTADSFAGLSSGYNRPDPGVTFTFPQVPAGKPASFMNASEHEVLFPPGRKIKITDNSNYPNLKAELYGTLLAAILGRQAAQYGGQNGNPG